MFGTVLLDIAIGLTFMYLSLSLVASSLAEFVELFLRARARTLEKGIRNLLFDKNGSGLALDIYKHPLIQGLAKLPTSEVNIDKVKQTRAIKPKWLPSYIPANIFITALLDTLTAAKRAQATGLDLKTIKDSLTSMTDNPKVKEALIALLPPSKAQAAQQAVQNMAQAAQQAIEDTTRELAQFRANLEDWYNGSMDRVAGWYKRHAQKVILVIGFLMAVAFNADTISAVEELARDRVLRESLVAAAERYVQTYPQGPARPGDSPAPGQPAPGEEVTAQDLSRQLKQVQTAIKDVQGLGLPVGWARGEKAPFMEKPFMEDFVGNLIFLLSKLLGWFLTAIAITLGAPFWFDLLNKFMVVRSTVKPHEKSPAEPSEDK